MPITQESLDFLFQNSMMNSRAWFQDHRADYHRLVVEPLAQLVTDLTPAMVEIDSAFITAPKIDKTISRIYRDMRIPANREKSFYRDNCWIVFIRDKKLYGGLPAFFFELTPVGFSYGMGYYQAATASMEVMREMILAKSSLFLEAQKAYESQKALALVGEDYKRPKYPQAPPELGVWLEKRSLSLVGESRDFDLLFSQNLAAHLEESFRRVAPVYRFFCGVEARRQQRQAP